ncbi:hypothetical protein [Massilia horti]|uniref:Apea-like HEPN domain-containing protein n=1 Tax=Massilia horti TaxID=2562153 RepID=A0A4Y9SZ77_9BURK|nr:hypothetical protein [Massilia horti]TFW31765.1 hypothetical protein E4O92_12510 [Massilia horti]
MSRTDGLAQALSRRAKIKKIEAAIAFFAANRAFLDRYEDLESFVFNAFEHDEKLAQGVEYHLVALRRQLLDELWSRHIFLSVNAIEQLLYMSLKADVHPFVAFCDCVLENGLHHPGLVLYPLHSFGFLGLGLFGLGRPQRVATLDLSAAGIELTPQTNNFDRSIAFVEFARKTLGIVHEVPRELLEHYYRSRPLKWFTQNPLLAVRVSSYASGYYVNQRILLMKLRLSTTLIAMVAVMGRREVPSEYHDFSTARVNNWETLDIAHYLLFQADPNKSHLSVDCTPMHVNRIELAELADLGVDIDPRAWKGKARRSQLTTIRNALEFLEDGYLRHCVIGSKSQELSRLFRKLLSSINYFRRSLRARGQTSENIVALAIAFETLLIDFYARGVTDRIHMRVRTCLAGKSGVAAMCDAVQELFVSRGKILHAGETLQFKDIPLARKAYVICFVHISQRLTLLDPKTKNPLSAIFL